MKHTPGYEVTQDGRVFSFLSNWRGYGRREMGQTPNADGYPSVRIMIKGKRKRIAVHRLVITQYLGPRPSKMHQTCHIDGSKTNNAASNLRWGTAKDNAIDRENHKKKRRAHE